MSRTPTQGIHYLAGSSIHTLKQTDASTIVGRITWVPGSDTATITRATDGKAATLFVDQINWDDAQGRPWPWGCNDAYPNHTGTPVVPA